MLMFFRPKQNTRGLLDTYLAASGFSLRQVKASYRKILTIRRSSDDATQDIYTSGGIINTSSILSFCGSGSGFVTTWYNTNGTDHAVQSNPDYQPRICDAGAIEVNEHDLPAIRFLKPGFGVGDHLIFSPFHSASQSYVGIFTAYSLAITGVDPYVMGSDPLDRGLLSLHNSNTRQVRTATIRSGGVTVANGTAITAGQTYIRHDRGEKSGRMQTYLDTTIAANIDVADGSTDYTMPTAYWMGSTNTPSTIVQNSLVHELLCFTGSADDHLAIRTNMASYWSA